MLSITNQLIIRKLDETFFNQFVNVDMKPVFDFTLLLRSRFLRKPLLES